jgi:hypothetical protein
MKFTEAKLENAFTEWLGQEDFLHHSPAVVIILANNNGGVQFMPLSLNT